MPTSQFMQLGTIVEAMVMLNPQSILDIGAGFGKYGVLAREYLDVAGDGGSYRNWKRRIDGIEVFRDYITPLHEFVYDRIYIGNASAVVSGLDRSYDLVLLVDVIEHLTKDEGGRLLRDSLAIGRNVLISTPRKFIEQHAVFDNVHEEHKSLWTVSDFNGFESMCVLPNPDDVSLVCVLGDDVERIRRELLGWRRRTKAFFPFLVKPFRAIKALFRQRPAWNRRPSERSPAR